MFQIDISTFNFFPCSPAALRLKNTVGVEKKISAKNISPFLLKDVIKTEKSLFFIK